MPSNITIKQPSFYVLFLLPQYSLQYTNLLASPCAMLTRSCTRSAAHTGHLVLGVCLEETCEDHSLVCQLCAKEAHQGHLVVTLNYLEQSYRTADSSSEFSQLIKTFGQEEQKLQKIAVESSHSLVQASSRIYEKVVNEHPFIQLLSNSFQRLQIPDIVKYISSSKTFSLQTMKTFLPVLRLYYFQGGYQLTSLKEEKLGVVRHFTELFARAESQIKTIIIGLEENILDYTLRKDSEATEQVVKEEHIEEEGVRTCQVLPESMVAEKMSEGRMSEGRMSEEKMMGSRMIVGQNMAKEEESVKTEAEKHKDILKKYNLCRKEGEDPARVTLRQTRQVKINTLLFYINVTNIKELTLSNNATTCVVNQASINQISKMVHLKALRMFWVKDLTDFQACTMLKHMLELRQLSLCQFQACSPLFINALKINNPKVRKLSFSIDLQHFLRYNEENIEFLPDSAYHYMDEQAWLTFSSGLRDLGTLELHHPENKQFWTKYLKKDPAKMLEFTLSNIDQTDCSRPAKTNKDYNYSPLLKCLEECSNLKALRFEQVHFDEKHLIRIIEKNPKIQTFMANECPNISNKSYLALGRHARQIEELSIQMDDQLAIESLQDMRTLKTLIIRGCWGIKENRLIDILAKLPQIKCLTMDYDFEWLTGKTLKALGKLSELKVLSISGNNITSADIQALNHVPYLNTLICSNNKFSYRDIIGFSFAKTLKKLSIGKNKALFPNENQHQEMNMAALVEAFPALTHLKLRGMRKIKPEFLGLMPRLICLTVVDTLKTEIEQCRNFCRRNDVYFNENTEEKQ